MKEAEARGDYEEAGRHAFTTALAAAPAVGVAKALVKRSTTIAAQVLNGRAALAVLETRRALAAAFYAATSIDAAKIGSHMACIDFIHEVKVVTIKAGTELVQWQRKSAKHIGDYFTEPGVDPKTLGLADAAERVPKRFVTTKDVDMLESIAKDTTSDLSVPPEYRAAGGGKQLFGQIQEAVKEVGPK
jgi:hypothetical protein